MILRSIGFDIVRVNTPIFRFNFSFSINFSIYSTNDVCAVPDDLHSARRRIEDSDVLSTLERCYRSIHEPSKCPNKITVSGGSSSQNRLPNSVPGSASSMRASLKTYLARFLKRSVFDLIKLRQTRLDHNLFDVIWPAMKKRNKNTGLDYAMDAGLVAPDFDVFVVFQEFLVPIIKDLHCIGVHSDFRPHPPTQYFPDGDADSIPAIMNINFDKTSKYVQAGAIECSRNLDQFELPLNLNIGQLEQSERIITGKLLSHDFAQTIDERDIGIYYTMNEVIENPSEIRTVLAAKGLLIPLLDSTDSYQAAESMAINGKYWPYGRGVYVSCNGDIVIWINCQEHLRLLSSTSPQIPGSIGQSYVKVAKAMSYLNANIEFRNSYFLGYLSARPSFLGTSLRLTVTLELPHLIKEPENLQNLCSVRGLYMLSHPTTNCIRVSNMQAMSANEWKIFHDYCTAVANVIQLEKDLSMESTKHIAAMLVNIFRKKKNSLGDIANSN